MANKRLGADSGLIVRMGVVLSMLTAVYLAFLIILMRMGVDFVGLLVFAALMLGAQYFFSHRLVLLASGAREVSREQAPELHARIECLAAQLDLPKPKVAIMETEIPNTFATGRSQKASVVAVTTGLLERLDGAELDGVLAYELSHIANRDVMVMTFASFFSTVAFFLVRWLLYMPYLGGGRRGRDSSGTALLLVWVVSMLVWAISLLLLRALSRYRESGSGACQNPPTRAPTGCSIIPGQGERTRRWRCAPLAFAFWTSPACCSVCFTQL